MSEYNERKRHSSSEEEFRGKRAKGYDTERKENPIEMEKQVNDLIRFYFSMHQIVTLYDLNDTICTFKGVDHFFSLGIGNILDNSEVQKLFKPSYSLESIPEFTQSSVAPILFEYLQNSEGNNFTEYDFLKVLAKRRSIKKVNELCVRVQNMESIGQFISQKRDKKFEQPEKSTQKETSYKSTDVDNELRKCLSAFVDLVSYYTSIIDEGATYITLQQRLYIKLKNVQHIDDLRPYYCFLSLVFAAYWKQNESSTTADLIVFTNKLKKIMDEGTSYNDLELLRLPFLYDLGIQLSQGEWRKYPNEFPSLASLIAKTLLKIRGYQNPLVCDILALLQKKDRLSTRRIVDKIFSKYHPRVEEGSESLSSTSPKKETEKEKQKEIGDWDRRTIKEEFYQTTTTNVSTTSNSVSTPSSSSTFRLPPTSPLSDNEVSIYNLYKTEKENFDEIDCSKLIEEF